LRHLTVGGCLIAALAGATVAGGDPGDGRAAGEVLSGADHGSVRGYEAVLHIKEPGYAAGLRIRLYYEPEFARTPPSAGHLFLVYADSAWGEDAFFVPSDLALEVGDEEIYRVESEQASDLMGQALGGHLNERESQLGFFLAPAPLHVQEVIGRDPSSVVVRYAHHRASFAPASAGEREEWHASVPLPRLMPALNAWWDWVEQIGAAPGMSAGEARFFAERIFPGQGEVLLHSRISPAALRNAILRVGERRLIDTPVIQRVAPTYPAAARQAGAEGLVVALAYVSEQGRVRDASLLASSTVHLLNVAALAAAMEWRFAPSRDRNGLATDGWRLIPFEFRLGGVPTASSGTGREETAASPPRILKAVSAHYPDKARRSRIEGTVVYRAVISPTGKLVEAVLEKPVHPLLDDAALAAVEKMLFSPALRDGVPVEGEILIPFRFPEEPRR